jgi:hypothetical protein
MRKTHVVKSIGYERNGLCLEAYCYFGDEKRKGDANGYCQPSGPGDFEGHAHYLTDARVLL